MVCSCRKKQSHLFAERNSVGAVLEGLSVDENEKEQSDWLLLISWEMQDCPVNLISFL